MSDYLTRLIDRSVGLPPQIEPLIAPIYAPSGQVLSEMVERPAVSESSPAAKIETLQKEASPGAAENARPVEAALSRAESMPSRPLAPRRVTQVAFPIGENDRPHSRKTSPRDTPRPAPPASRAEISPTAPPPIPGPTELVSKEKNQIGVQPELIRTELISKGKDRMVVPPELISHLKPATAPAVSLLQPSPKEPPAIHVSIGRVEVRAIMPPVAAPKPTPPSAPKLSLEDYLKQRNGGKS